MHRPGRNPPMIRRKGLYFSSFAITLNKPGLRCVAGREPMPQETDAKAGPETDADLRQVLDNAKAEPVPGKIIELAEKLEGVLAAKRKPQKPR